MDKSGSIQIWPIQCRIVNIQHAKPIVVGIYKGVQKPCDSNIFLEKFVADIRKIIYNGGINFYDNKIPIRLRCFIADASARAFILNHRSHVWLISLVPSVKFLGYVMKIVMFAMALIILFVQMKNIFDVWTRIIIKKVEVLYQCFL